MAQEHEPAAFVWPPKRAGLEAGAPARAPSSEFVSVGEPRVLVRRVGDAASSLTPWRVRIREVERVWLGLTTPPLAERMAEAGWAPDSSAAYCGRCGATAGPHDADVSGCSDCRGDSVPWERVVRLGEFDGLLREVIHEVKFTRWRRLGDELGRLLGRAIAERAEAAGLNPAQIVLIPAPASFRRRMVRGIDHTLVIARGAARELDCGLVQALQRRHRPSQTSLPPSRRAANVSGVFRFRSGCLNRVAGRAVVLLDDVTTTRATLRAACREIDRGLRPLSASPGGGATRIWAAVLAVTPGGAGKRRDAGAVHGRPSAGAQGRAEAGD